MAPFNGSEDKRLEVLDVCRIRKDAGLNCRDCTFWDRTIRGCSQWELLQAHGFDQAVPPQPEPIQPKLITCIQCGNDVPRTNSQQEYCEECAAAKKRKGKKGVLRNYVSKQPIICEDCGTEVPRRGNRQKYCVKCSAARRAEQVKYKPSLRSSTPSAVSATPGAMAAASTHSNTADIFPPIEQFAQFVGALQTRLDKGRQEYGDKSFARPVGKLLGKLEQEAIDLAGWGFVLWVKLQRLKQEAKRP